MVSASLIASLLSLQFFIEHVSCPRPAQLVSDTFLCASLVGQFTLLTVTGDAHISLNSNCSSPALLDLITKTLNHPFPVFETRPNYILAPLSHSHT